MKAKYIISIALIVIVSSIIYFTKLFSIDKQNYTQQIKPPSSALDIPFEEYNFNADSGVVINTKTGSQVRIKPGTLVNGKGEKVKGIINMKIREFHDPTSLFLAGIPMSTDANRTSFLQSGGMFELRAFSNGQELNLQKGESADIELASYKNTDGYKLYYFNDNSSWAITDTFITKVNDRKTRANDSLNKLKKEYLDVDIVTDLTSVPVLIPYKNLKWRIEKNGQEQALNEAMRVNWDVIKIKPIKNGQNQYKLSFTKYLNKWKDSNLVRTYSTLATPIYKGKKLSKRKNKELENEVAAINIRIDQEKERIAKQADLVSSFKIDRMGIWNIDKVLKLDDMIWADVEFDFEKNIDPILNKVSIYLIFEEENSVIEYLPRDWNRIGFKKNAKMKIKAVLPGQQIVEVDDIQIQAKISKNGKIKFTTQRK
jgi:hypothetical protein